MDYRYSYISKIDPSISIDYNTVDEILDFLYEYPLDLEFWLSTMEDLARDAAAFDDFGDMRSIYNHIVDVHIAIQQRAKNLTDEERAVLNENIMRQQRKQNSSMDDE